MSETVDLKDVLLNATEATSIADTDRLVMFGSNGELKKIDRGNLQGSTKCNLLKGGAYKFLNKTMEQFKISPVLKPGDTVTLSVSEIEVVDSTGINTLLYIDLYQDTMWIAWVPIYFNDKKHISFTIPDKPIAGQEMHLNIYPSSTNRPTGAVKLRGLALVKGSVPMSGWAPSPEDIIALSGGGVNALLTMCYKFQQKGGGLRDGRHYGTDQRFVERSDDGCDGEQRSLLQYKRNLKFRDIYRRRARMLRGISQFLCFLEIRHIGGFRREGRPCIPTSNFRHFGDCHSEMDWTVLGRLGNYDYQLATERWAA